MAVSTPSSKTLLTLYVSLVVDGIDQRKDDQYRPALEDGRCPLVLQRVISACWRQRPEDRPSIEEVLNLLEGIPSPEEDEADGVDNKELDTDYALRRELRKAELLARIKIAVQANIDSNAAGEEGGGEEGGGGEEEASDGEDDGGGGRHGDELSEEGEGDEAPSMDESLEEDQGWVEELSDEEANDLVTRYCTKENTLGVGGNATGKVNSPFYFYVS